MQNPVKPGYSNPLYRLIGHGRQILSALFLLLFTAGFQFNANALPPGVPDMTHPNTVITVLQDNSRANNADKNIVRAHVVDSDGNPVDGVTVYFTAGNVTIAVVTGGSLGAGNAQLDLASGVVGTVDVSATVGGISFNNQVTVTFIAYQPSASASELQIVTNGALANNTATNSVRAIVRDADGNPIANQSVTFQITSGTATFSGSATGTTDANGVVVVSLISNTIGGVAVTATINSTPNVAINDSETVQFVDEAPSVNNPATQLIIVDDNAIANGTATNRVRAHVVDINGDPVVAQTVTFVINSGTATPSALTVFTDANGDAFLTLTSNVVGPVEIAASVNGVPMTALNNSPVTVLFVADAPSVNVPTTRLEVITTGATADDVDLNTVRAVITDANGNPAAGQTIVFAIYDGTAVFVGSTTLTTDANGVAIINLQSTTAGLVHVVATVNGFPIVNGSPAEVEFVAGPPDMSNPLTTLIIDANNADANGVAQNIVRAHVVDAYGNPVAAQNIEFFFAGVATAGGPLVLTTDANGDAVLTLTSTTVGSVDVTANLNGAPIPNGSPATVLFTTFPDPANPSTYIVVVTDNAFANGTATNSVRAHVVDNEGNPMVGATVVFTIESGDATITTPQPVLTDANGDAIILLTSTKAGIVNITATADGTAIINGSPARIRFTEENIWVPRVFTPNGDGTNDMVRPIANGIFNLTYFNIYNRWGNLLFTTKNLSDGWDGRFKGAMQPNETYMWIIVGTDSNNQRVQKRGMISLVR